MNLFRAALLSLFAAAAAQAACITDDTNQKICVDAPPKRAISLYGAFTETLSSLGAAPTLVARTKSDDNVAAVAKLPSVGTGLRPNVELVLALKPDLVVSRSGKAAGEAVDALRARGLKVAAFDPTGLDELYSVIGRLGVLWGREAEGKQLADKIRGDVARVEKKTAGVEKKRRVVYEVRSEPLTVAGSGGMLDEVIQAAGGENAVKAPKKILSFDPEALLRLDPDVYVVQVGAMNPRPVPPADRPSFQVLRAVRENHVLTVEEDLFAHPGPHIAEAAEKLSRFLYPQLWGNKKDQK